MVRLEGDAPVYVLEHLPQVSPGLSHTVAKYVPMTYAFNCGGNRTSNTERNIMSSWCESMESFLSVYLFVNDKKERVSGC